jgi:methyl-accepting chemotaxis protein
MSLNLSTKLLALVVFMVAALCGFAGYAVYSMVAVGKQVDHITAVESPISHLVAATVQHQLQQEMALHISISIAGQGRGAMADEYIANFNSYGAKVEDEIAKIDALLTTAVAEGDDRVVEYNEIEKLVRKIEKEHTEISEIGQGVITQLISLIKASNGRIPRLSHLSGPMNEIEDIQGRLNTHVAGLLKRVDGLTEESVHKIGSSTFQVELMSFPSGAAIR